MASGPPYADAIAPLEPVQQPDRHRCEDQEHEGDEEVEDEGQARRAGRLRSEEHTSELQSLMRISYAVFCLKKKKTKRCTHRDSREQQKINIKEYNTRNHRE